MRGREHAASRQPRRALTLRRAVVLALAGLALAAPAARAAPTRVSLRVEGGSQTLFEGPIASEGHAIEASSDTQLRSCDGINPNEPENTSPGATPTAAAVDAMTLIGQTFDGRWYESYDDYLITRWGPVHEAEGHSWFVIVNHVLTSIGGCQVELHEGEVVWAYALASPAPKAMLELYPQDDVAAVPPETADATVGVPFGIEVQSVAVASGKPPEQPERVGFAPAPGAKVAPVNTSANGFEAIEAESPQAVLAGAEGRASVTFTTLGWHRLKATRSGAVAANRLDVCVSTTGTPECGPPPAEDAVRSITGEEPVTETPPVDPAPRTSSKEADTRAPTGNGSPGLVGKAPAPTLQVAGYSLAALDVNDRMLHFHGRWKRIRDAAAWHDLAAVGVAGATLSTRLAAGVPAFAVLYCERARLEVIAGKRRRVFTLTASRAPSLLRGLRRLRGGPVELRVISGEVAIDGVAVIH